MTDSFYASGFLYNIKTQKILLLQSEKNSDLSSSWSLLTAAGKENQEPAVAFQEMIKKRLDINLKMEDIFPIYDYIDKNNKTNYVFYAEVKDSPVLSKKNEDELSWVTFGETLKLLFLANTKQDLTVGERVIQLKSRIDQNIQPKVFGQ